MTKRLVTILVLTVLGLAAGGCTRCGFFWDDGPKSCRSDTPR